MPVSPTIRTRGFRRRHLLRAAHRFLHGGIAHHHRVALAGRRFEDCDNQVRIGRQRQELARALANGACGGFRIVAGAASHDRDRHTLTRQRAHHGADVVHHIAQHEIDAGIRTQSRQRSVGVIRLVELRSACDGDARSLAKFTCQRAYDQDAHGGRPPPDPPPLRGRGDTAATPPLPRSGGGSGRRRGEQPSPNLPDRS